MTALTATRKAIKNGHVVEVTTPDGDTFTLGGKRASRMAAIVAVYVGDEIRKNRHFTGEWETKTSNGYTWNEQVCTYTDELVPAHWGYHSTSMRVAEAQRIAAKCIGHYEAVEVVLVDEEVTA